MSDFLTFLKGRAAEMLLLTVCCAALFSTITYGFHVDDALRAAWPAIIGLPLCLTVYFTCISYTPKAVAVGSVVFVVLFAITAAAASAVCGHAFFYDEYGSTGFFILLGTLTTLLGYVMTRRKTLTFLFAVGGCFACGLVQFLYLNGLVVQAVAFAFAAVALCVVCTRRSTKGIAADEVSPLHFLATGAVMSGIALLVAGLVFGLVIAPLNPPEHEIKLFTEYFSLEVVHVRGEQMVEHRENEDMVSNNEQESDKNTNHANDNTEDAQGNMNDNSQVSDEGEADLDTQGTNVTGFGQETQATNYFLDINVVFFVIPAVLLLMILVFVAKKLLRRRRYKRMLQLEPQKRIEAFYCFFDKRLPRLGISREGQATPLEHAANTASTVQILERDAQGATYLQLAAAYCRSVYGCGQPTQEELDCCSKLYGVFYKNARTLTGAPRYLRLFFLL